MNGSTRGLGTRVQRTIHQDGSDPTSPRGCSKDPATRPLTMSDGTGRADGLLGLPCQGWRRPNGPRPPPLTLLRRGRWAAGVGVVVFIVVSLREGALLVQRLDPAH